MNLCRSIIAVLVSLTLSSCGGAPRPGPEACADPKLLSVAIGGEVFAFSESVDGWKLFGEKKEDTGVIDFKRPNADEGYRSKCNKKDQPIADFGDWINFPYKDEVLEPDEWFNFQRDGKRRLSFGGRILIYESDHPALQHSDYISDVENIEDIEFVKRTPQPRIGSMPGVREDFEFRYNNKTLVLECSVGIYEDQTDGSTIIGEGGMDSCINPTRFRFGDILVELDTGIERNVEGELIDIPPEEWPQMWAYKVNTILNFRVTDAEGAQQ